VEKIIAGHPEKYQLYLEAETITKRVERLGREISSDYAGKNPLLVCVLNGSFIFFADLLRAIEIDCEVDFIRIESYGLATASSGSVRLSKDLSRDVSERHVLLVEDIVDSGLSAAFLLEHVAGKKPKSLRFVTLLNKIAKLQPDLPLDYVGFSIDNDFVIGYGLDIAHKKRNLRSIYKVVKDDVDESGQ
jgi:hypoxanthine phosphoribosyltransferase